MFTILLHTSKTTRTPTKEKRKPDHVPALLTQANIVAKYLKQLNEDEIRKAMNVSANMAAKTYELIHKWEETPKATLPAIDLFLGDIYSGLQAQSFSREDREYAHDHLYILSGIYGVIKALDEIQPYRLEMGYRLPAISEAPQAITSLYDFWSDTIARQLPKNQAIINLSAVEYSKAIFPYFKSIDGLQNVQVISPKFLTLSPKTNEPVFVTVHAKIARGAFARWLIQNRIDTADEFIKFDELGYIYELELSTENEPVYVAKEFKGLGLSVRLT